MSKNKTKMVPFEYQMRTKLNFGKYKGRQVSDILYSKPNYLDWARKNVAWFKISDTVKVALEKELDDRRSFAYSYGTMYDEDYDADFKAAYEF